MTKDLMNDFSDRDRFCLRDDLVVEEVDDEFLILDLHHNTYFGLNGIGRRIWEGLADEKSIAEIVDGICESYHVEREQAASDTRAFIDEILEKNLAKKLVL